MSDSTAGVELTLLLFNDVYHTDDAALVARFATVFADPTHITGRLSPGSQPLRVFSGDVFSPSLEAPVLRRDHMTEVLNHLRLDVACYGNHDFDFGEERLAELSDQNNFPWTLSNVVRVCGLSMPSPDQKLLPRAHRYVVKECAGYRIGFFGLAGTKSDWPSNCLHLPECHILGPCQVARDLASHLRLSEQCDLVVAVTHMRLAEDLKVARATAVGSERVDLLLGGHDHAVVRHTGGMDEPDTSVLDGGCQQSSFYRTGSESDLQVVKSGTDWRGLSMIRLKIQRDQYGFDHLSHTAVHQIGDLTQRPDYRQITLCPEVLRVISNTQNKITTSVEKLLWHTDVPLDGRSHIVRCHETNLGDMLADAVRAFYNSDIAFVNSGAIRCDRIIPPTNGKPLRIRDVMDISPFDNALVVKRISGRTIRAALENSVSDAHTDGRFLQVAGLCFSFDWLHPEGERCSEIKTTSQSGTTVDLEDGRLYTVTMVTFIASGFDGYSCFEGAETVVSSESAMTDTNLLLEVLRASYIHSTGDTASMDYDASVARAGKSIVHRMHEVDGLPVVRPSKECRIKAIA